MGGWGVEKHIISLRKLHPQWWPATNIGTNLSPTPSSQPWPSSNSSLSSRRSHWTAASRSSYTSYSSDHGASADNERTEYTAFISTKELIDIDVSDKKRLMSSLPAVPPLPPFGKIAPDEHGSDIPLDAIWTKISRRIVGPGVLERAGVRYEARPEFVAILGVVNKETIIKWARQSAEIRHSRHTDPDPDLQAWDSDLDAWGLWESESSGEESSDSRPTRNPDRAMAENIDASSPRKYRDRDRAAPAHRDRERDRTSPPRSDRDREKDRSRVAQKKTEVRELLGAVGIGGAAATLLSVLREAAQDL